MKSLAVQTVQAGAFLNKTRTVFLPITEFLSHERLISEQGRVERRNCSTYLPFLDHLSKEVNRRFEIWPANQTDRQVFTFKQGLTFKKDNAGLYR